MMLNDLEIEELCVTENPMISPFVDRPTREVGGNRVISFGLSTCGYDIRLANTFTIPTTLRDLDPLKPNDMQWVSNPNWEGGFSILGNSFVLAHSLEEFDMPEDVCAQCLGKSTYARNGIFVNVTPLEPGWKGVLTIEIANLGPNPVIVHPGQGIAQLQFFKIAKPRTSYAAKGGKYQGQTGVTLGKV